MASVSTTVFLVILLSAVLHAGWNAAVKASGDRTLSMATVSMAGSFMCILALPFVEGPPPEAWPWMFAGFLGSFGTQAILARAYSTGELSVAYPLTRGLAPVTVTAAGALLFSEVPGPLGLAGVVAIALGVALLAADSMRAGGHAGTSTLGLALSAAVITALYTLANAKGARLSPSALNYAVWSSVPNGVVWLGVMLVQRRDLKQHLRTDALRSLGGGLVSNVAYVLVLWCMRQAPVALVSALRETSVLFSILMGVFWLKERASTWRWMAGGMICSGLFLLRSA
ncbi:EamA family transporter [Cystobacter fuscus]|nr:EamA family transporter [Cystobacter fuscus]